MAAADSLFFVFANTLAASVTFMRRRAVDISRGLTIAGAGIPSSILGAYVVRLMSGRDFDFIYGVFLIATAILIVMRRNKQPDPRNFTPNQKLAA